MAKRRKDNRTTFTLAVKPEARPDIAAPIKVKVPASFEYWWITRSSNWGIRPEMKQIIKSFFDANGIVDFDDFDKGLKEFGLRS